MPIISAIDRLGLVLTEPLAGRGGSRDRPHSRPGYFFLRDLGVCDSAEPAAVLDALDVRPSRNVFEAALAARRDVTLLELPRLGIALTSSGSRGLIVEAYCIRL